LRKRGRESQISALQELEVNDRTKDDPQLSTTVETRMLEHAYIDGAFLTLYSHQYAGLQNPAREEVIGRVRAGGLLSSLSRICGGAEALLLRSAVWICDFVVEGFVYCALSQAHVHPELLAHLHRKQLTDQTRKSTGCFSGVRRRPPGDDRRE
jgi:hypothetical protein